MWSTSNSSSLSIITNRLERHDESLTDIDLRGKFLPRGFRSPRIVIREFAKALEKSHVCKNPSQQQQHGEEEVEQLHWQRSSPPQPQSCNLQSLAIHNHFLDSCELPLLFDALRYLPTLETFVLFHHDVGDESVELLMDALMGRKVENKVKVSVPEDDVAAGAVATLNAMPSASEESSSTNKKSYSDKCISSMQKPCSLRELYLSHCNITCKGAEAISKALLLSSSLLSLSPDDSDDNKLKCLKVLSLGSNRIKDKGATSLATAFAKCRSLHRLVLHGNIGITSCTSSSTTLNERPIFHYALSPEGWQQFPILANEELSTQSKQTKITTPSSLTMAILSPLILPHVKHRWAQDRVLLRPHDLMRKQLHDELYKKHFSFVDNHLEVMPEILSWMGRVGFCCGQGNMHSLTRVGGRKVNFEVRGEKIHLHSSGVEECHACKIVHLDDVYELLLKKPQLVGWFKSISFMR